MPILTEASPPKKRRAAAWLLVLALVILPPMGLFAWSWYRPVMIAANGRWLTFGFFDFVDTSVPVVFGIPVRANGPRSGYWQFKLGEGCYAAVWSLGPN